jgi:hypothetical protein
VSPRQNVCDFIQLSVEKGGLVQSFEGNVATDDRRNKDRKEITKWNIS